MIPANERQVKHSDDFQRHVERDGHKVCQANQKCQEPQKSIADGRFRKTEIPVLRVVLILGERCQHSQAVAIIRVERLASQLATHSQQWHQ